MLGMLDSKDVKRRSVADMMGPISDRLDTLIWEGVEGMSEHGNLDANTLFTTSVCVHAVLRHGKEEARRMLNQRRRVC